MDLINNKLVSDAVGFLLTLYKDNIPAIAAITSAQADGDLDHIIEDLEDVRDTINYYIGNLKKLKENG